MTITQTKAKENVKHVYPKASAYHYSLGGLIRDWRIFKSRRFEIDLSDWHSTEGRAWSEAWKRIQAEKVALKRQLKRLT
jgi:hypothetical protein